MDYVAEQMIDELWERIFRRKNKIKKEGEMELTKKQKQEIYNCHSGAGELIINSGENELRQVHVHLGRNGKWYTGNMELFPYLKSLANELEK